MNILITNAVPLNGGDEALLRATIESLRARWPESRITTLCNNFELTRRHLLDLAMASDLEFVCNRAALQPITELYRAANLVLSAPGGIFHDHYPIQHRLRGLEFAINLGKTVVLFAQSVGPFWKEESIKRVREVFNQLGAICVRDSLSRTHLLECGIDAAKIRQTADAAFLWRQIAPELFQPKSTPVRTIGLCFRVWPLNDTSVVKETIANAHQLCRDLLAPPEREILFLSTCQGIPGYVDDSQLAGQIVDSLPHELKARCRIDGSRYGPRDLMRVLARCDAFIGMRLHACILAMLAGTPAMGLGYESKTDQIFGQLGFQDLHVRFDAKAESWLRCAEQFLTTVPEIRRQLPTALDRLCRQAVTNLDLLDELRDQISQTDPPFTVEQRADALKRSNQYLDNLYERIQWNEQSRKVIQEVATFIPQEESFILLDENIIDRDLFTSQRPVPFVEKDGEYWGPPSDEATAVAEFERLRQTGLAFAVVAFPAFWWLEHYPGFASYLESNFVRLVQTDSVIILSLRRRPMENNKPVALASDNSIDSRRATIFEVIDRVRTDGLTYLSCSALVDLHAAVSNLEKESMSGLFIEAGCALGGSALVIGASKAAARRLFLYDVFGMIPAPSPTETPEVHERYRIIKSGESSGLGGKFYYGYEEDLMEKITNSFERFGLPLEANAISLVKGLYEKTLYVSDPVAFAHIDCDWYDSVLTCLQRIEPRLVNHGILVIDDYFVWSGCRRAVDEYFANKMAYYEFQTKSRLHIVRRQRVHS